MVNLVPNFRGFSFSRDHGLDSTTALASPCRAPKAERWPRPGYGPHRGAPILIHSSQLGKHHLSITRPGLGHTGCVTGHTGQSACSGPWAVQSSRIHPVQADTPDIPWEPQRSHSSGQSLLWAESGLLSGHVRGHTLTPSHTLSTLAQLAAGGCACVAGAMPFPYVLARLGQWGSCVRSAGIHLSHSKIRSSIQVGVGFSSSFQKQPPEECFSHLF